MKHILASLLLGTALLLSGGSYGKILPLKQIPGVDEGAMAAALDGDTLWIAGSRGSLFAFDVSIPNRPKRITKIRVLKNGRQMAICNGVAAIVGRQSGMALVDIRNPEKPKILSHYQSIELALSLIHI